MKQPSRAPQLPAAILEQYSSWSFTPVSVHPGNSAMYRLSEGEEVRFAKVVRKGWFPSAAAEVERSIWASGYVPVPEIVQHGVSDEATWFVSRAIAGVDATSEHFRSDIAGLVRRLGSSLRQFHAMPVADCPFSFRLDDALAHAEQRLRRGQINPALDFHPEHEGLTAHGALMQLVATRPDTEDLAVCHGDFCAPNILFRDQALSGFVDLGEMGVADRWWDLAIATWSVSWNFGPGYEDAFLHAYGIALDPHRLRYYRLLYDVVS